MAGRRSFADLSTASNNELRALAQVVSRFDEPRRYPSACLLHPFVGRAEALASRLPDVLPEGVITDDQRRLFDAVTEIHSSLDQTRDAAIAKFVETELEAMSGFFDELESNPLTPEQRLAVVTDEDATLVLAGAGSGKTSVIVAKAAYLIQRAIRRPEQILLMVFGKDAAEEMASRIEERYGSAVDARTFHALDTALSGM